MDYCLHRTVKHLVNLHDPHFFCNLRINYLLWEKAIKKQNAVKLIEEPLALEDLESKRDAL